MTKSERQTRLDQFEIREQFGIWPDYKLIKGARQASEALFRFDTLCAGSSWIDKSHGGLKLGLYIAWENPDVTQANFSEGVPHLIREYLDKDPDRPGYLIGGNWRDCGKVRNADKAARSVVAELSDWFNAHGAPNVRAEFGGDLRYIVITDGARVYSLID